MRTLFIGNSHTYYNDLPHLFARACEEHGVRMDVAMLASPGIGLDEHSTHQDVRFNILYGNYDYIILQHRAHPMGDLDSMSDGVRILMEYIRRTKAQPVFYMTWSKKADPEGQAPMSAIYRELGREYGAKVAPVGEYWWKYREEHPDVELYDEDGAHASLRGSRLAARVLYRTIFEVQLNSEEMRHS